MRARALIVGGDGLIGAALARGLADRWDVVVTSRRGGGVALELGGPFDAAAVTDGFDVVVLCAAVTGRAACEADPKAAFAVNVVAPEALAAPVLARGGQVVFLSTHIVLGGDQAFLRPDASYAPVDVYSRQKAEAELRLLALPDVGAALSVVRLTKVLDWSSGVLAGWASKVAQGAVIDAFTDLVMAPVTVGHVVDRLKAMLGDRPAEILHVSGAEEISFAGLAQALADQLGWPSELVNARAGRPVNPIAASTPRHASLAAPRAQSLADVVEALAASFPGSRVG